MHGCGESTVVIERYVSETDGWVGQHWWPVPGAGGLDPSVPVAVESANDEGSRCLAIKADRAAVVMLRAMLAEIVADKGSSAAQGKQTLYAQLEQMAKDNDLHPTMVEWAKEIRVVGNAGAHPSTLEPVGRDDAVALSQLARQMVHVLYEVPARIQRNRQARSGTSSP